MIDDVNDSSIVKAIIALSKNLGREEGEEGIETEQNYQLLLEMWCDIGTG